jgi:hypothetical protein
VVGIFLKRISRFPQNAHIALNSFVIYVSFPATVLIQITKLFSQNPLSFHMLLPASMGWMLFLVSWGLFSWIGKKRGWSPARTGALILTAGLGNTSFVGFPLLEAMMGAEAVQWGVLVDQLGSFFVLSTLGIVVASTYGRARDGKSRSILNQVSTFPPFIALCMALVLSSFGFVFTGMSEQIVQKLAGTLVPLSLVSVGLHLKLSMPVLKRYWRPLSLGLSFKLFFAPLGFFLLYAVALGDHSFVARVTILESAMATMITSAVVAGDYCLDEELANLMVGVSIPLSLITVSGWHGVLTQWP